MQSRRLYALLALAAEAAYRVISYLGLQRYQRLVKCRLSMEFVLVRHRIVCLADCRWLEELSVPDHASPPLIDNKSSTPLR